MRLISLLNHYQHFPGFVYEKARLCAASQTIEITVRPRRGSRPVCSGCHQPASGYDHLSLRRFEFVPLWGCMVVLLYHMRRVDCRACGVRVEAVPWGIGKHQLTKAYMLFLAHWARKLSWQETASSFRSTWDKVSQSVEYVVRWGLEHRQLGPIVAIGVDEIQYAKGHKYLLSDVAGFSRASIAVLSREICPTKRSACVSWINASCNRDGKALAANSAKARENVASLGTSPARCQPHSRRNV